MINPTPISLIGQILNGCELQEYLGQGTIGDLYMAVHLESNQKVAVKMLDPLFANDQELFSAFSRRAQQLSELKDEHITRLYSLRKFNEGAYLVREYVEGQNLTDYAEQHGPLSAKKAIEWMKVLLQTLEIVHNAGLTHANIAPQNILISSEGSPQLSDFLLVPYFLGSRFSSFSDANSAFKNYAAPEQFSNPNQLDPQSDLYALALCFVEQLSTSSPFDLVPVNFAQGVDTTTELKKRLRPDVLPEVADILVSAIDSDKENRYTSAREMLDDLEAIGQPRTSRTSAPPPPPEPPPRQDRPPSPPPPPTVQYRASNGRPFYRHIRLKYVAIVLMATIGASAYMMQPEQVNPFEAMALAASEDSAFQVEPAILNTSPTIAEAAPPPDIPPPTPVDPPSIEEETETADPIRDDVGRLSISTSPDGAYILLDDIPYGTAPRIIEDLPARPMRIVLTLPGYESVTQEIQVVPQQTAQLSVELPPRKGQLTVNIMPWGDVYVNERLTRRRIEGEQILAVPFGEQKISIVHPAYGRWERTATIVEGEAVSFSVDFKRRITLSITSFDTDAAFVVGEVFINGRSTGQMTPADVEVPIGMQTIEVRAAGYVPTDPPRPINVDPSLVEPMEFVLRKSTSAP